MVQRTEYMKAPAGIANNSARAHGWGDGWPACLAKEKRPPLAEVSRAGVKIFVRREIGPLVATLFDATEQRFGYDIKPGQTWGYGCRAVRGSKTTPSNHSWGLAIDINAPSNPMGRTFRSDIPPGVVAMWWDCGFYWGGWYRTRPDAMHFEYVHRPSDVANDLATATRYAAGGGAALTVVARGAMVARGTAAAGAVLTRNLLLARPFLRGDDVSFVQQRLNAKGASPQLKVDGVWGRKTDAALRAFQQQAGLKVDGICGPKSHAALSA
jgi:hypothetical protein